MSDPSEGLRPASAPPAGGAPGAAPPQAGGVLYAPKQTLAAQTGQAYQYVARSSSFQYQPQQQQYVQQPGVQQHAVPPGTQPHQSFPTYPPSTGAPGIAQMAHAVAAPTVYGTVHQPVQYLQHSGSGVSMGTYSQAPVAQSMQPQVVYQRGPDGVVYATHAPRVGMMPGGVAYTHQLQPQQSLPAAQFYLQQQQRLPRSASSPPDAGFSTRPALPQTPQRPPAAQASPRKKDVKKAARDAEKAAREARLRERKERKAAEKREKKERKQKRGAGKEESESDSDVDSDGDSSEDRPPPLPVRGGGGSPQGVAETMYYGREEDEIATVLAHPVQGAEETEASRQAKANEHEALKRMGDFVISRDQLVFGKQIGSGSLGEVFEGTYLGTAVAIKKLKLMSKQAAMSFLCELNTMRNLRHPNVMLYMGICVEPPPYLLVTEYIPMGSLSDYLHGPKGGKKKKLEPDLTVEQIRSVLESAARGMNYLHNKDPKIIHRDLKSANLMLTDTFQVKIADFGVALSLQDTMKEGTSLVGSPHWVAPEIIRGEDYNEKCDVYSFAIIMWEVLERRRPYEGLNEFQILNKVGMNRERLPISRSLMQKLNLRPYVSLMQKCWAEAPVQRPSFAEIVEILAELSSKEVSEGIANL